MIDSIWRLGQSVTQGAVGVAVEGVLVGLCVVGVLVVGAADVGVAVEGEAVGAAVGVAVVGRGVGKYVGALLNSGCRQKKPLVPHGLGVEVQVCEQQSPPSQSHSALLYSGPPSQKPSPTRDRSDARHSVVGERVGSAEGARVSRWQLYPAMPHGLGRPAAQVDSQQSPPSHRQASVL